MPHIQDLEHLHSFLPFFPSFPHFTIEKSLEDPMKEKMPLFLGGKLEPFFSSTYEFVFLHVCTLLWF